MQTEQNRYLGNFVQGTGDELSVIFNQNQPHVANTYDTDTIQPLPISMTGYTYNPAPTTAATVNTALPLHFWQEGQSTTATLGDGDKGNGLLESIFAQTVPVSAATEPSSEGTITAGRTSSSRISRVKGKKSSSSFAHVVAAQGVGGNYAQTFVQPSISYKNFRDKQI